MILPLFRRAPPADTISTLYGTIVAQARLPGFYRDYGVPDTVDGRFELIVLHLALLLRRLSGEAEPIRALGQQVFDRFCQDMDRNLREIGISDLKVPLEMRRMGEAFYGRARAYEAALMDPNPAVLVEAIARNVYAGGPDRVPGASRLATYMRNAAAALGSYDAATLVRGELTFPDPATGGEARP
jgi:cytochrome b pre-mRNA-processing protein 3